MTMPSDDPMFKRGAASARRIEVFTGAGRRREWSVEQKAAIIAESYAGELNVCDVARRHGLTPSQLFTWRRNARRKAIAADEARDAFFVPAVVGEDIDKPTVHTGETVIKPAPILELEIGGSSVWVWSEAEVELVTAVVRALKGAR